MATTEKREAVESAPKMDAYAIYLRKSRADLEAEKLGEGETLARHEKILTELAVRKGLYVAKIYKEIVSGAETIEGRPQIRQLIEDCYKGLYRGIIIVEVTRLSRGSQHDAQTIMDCLKYSNHNAGLLVVTPTKTYDVAHNQDDEAFMDFELFMSRREYKMIKQRMDRGKMQCIVDGEYMSSYRPYGWVVVKEGKKRTLDPKPDEYRIGKMIYKWRIEGLTPYKIAQRLTTMGVPTYTKKSKDWSKETVKDFLRNPVNMGKVRWNDRMQVRSMANGELKTSRPRSNHTEHYMLFDGIHKDKAMVTEEEWRMANKDFISDRTKSNLKLQNPLAGLLICSKCGKTMRHQRYANKPNVQPRFYHPESQFCKVKSVFCSDVMEAIVAALKRDLTDCELNVDNLPEVDEETITAQIDALQSEIRKTEKKLAKAFDDYEDGVYSANEFVQRKAVHNERIESIRAQIEALEDSIPEKEAYEEKIMALHDALNALLDETIPADIKNSYLKEIIDRIEFSRDSDDEFSLDIYLK